jgi:hypothetical protein
MRNSAIVFTGVAVAFGVFSAIAPSAAVPIAVPRSSCINWVPTISVQLGVSSLATKDPVDVPDLVPHPDKDKCPCKGTGVITHGDGHTTECPYHGADAPAAHKCKCDSPGYYCACEEKHGKCSCPALLTRAQQKKAYMQAMKNSSWLSRLFLGLRG